MIILEFIWIGDVDIDVVSSEFFCRCDGFWVAFYEVSEEGGDAHLFVFMEVVVKVECGGVLGMLSSDGVCQG